MAPAPKGGPGAGGCGHGPAEQGIHYHPRAPRILPCRGPVLPAGGVGGGSRGYRERTGGVGSSEGREPRRRAADPTTCLQSMSSTPVHSPDSAGSAGIGSGFESAETRTASAICPWADSARVFSAGDAGRFGTPRTSRIRPLTRSKATLAANRSSAEGAASKSICRRPSSRFNRTSNRAG